MNNETDWIIVGRFGRPQGLKGFVRVISFTEPEENIIHYSSWYFKNKGTWQPLNVLSVDKSNKFILAQIDNCWDREQAALLTNKEIGIMRSALPNLPAGEYYWHDLIGMAVVNQQGIQLGDVTELLATGSNDVLVVQKTGDTGLEDAVQTKQTSHEKRLLIPYLLNESVINIDTQKRIITVDWDADF